MRKSLMLLVSLAVLSLTLIEICNAQLINYNRRKNAAQAPANTSETAPASIAVTPEPVAVPSSEVSENTAEVASNFKVTNRIEAIYDMDKDEILQAEEVNAFLKDVVSAVDKKGSFNVSSDILKQFDHDSDGRISKSESKAIESTIR